MKNGLPLMKFFLNTDKKKVRKNIILVLYT
jgi:hypothetical protein